MGVTLIINSSIEGNQCISTNCDGGGVWVSGTLMLSGTTLMSNTADGDGGGFWAQSDAIVYDSVVSGNSGKEGGGALVYGSAWVDDSLFENNEGIGLGVIDTLRTTNSVYSANNTSTVGGGLAASYLYMTDTYVISNTAGDFSDGAGVFIDVEGVIVDSVFAHNRCQGNVDCVGGGVWISGTLMISNTVFNNNMALSGGGGVYGSGSMVVHNSSFTSNLCTEFDCFGGGLATSGTLSLSQSVFVGNEALDGRGGALYVWQSDSPFNGGDETAVLVNNLFADNKAGLEGAGLFFEERSVELVHNTIGASANISGQAVYVLSGTAALTNTIISSYSVGIENAGGIVSEDYNLFYGNGVDVSGTVASGGSTLVGDPDFVDPVGGDFHIGFGSAGLDNGLDLGVTVDLDGNLRPSGSGPDRGAYELGQAPVAVGLYPAMGSHQAPLTSAVVITFDQHMSPTSMTTKTFAVQAMQTGVLTEVYVVDGQLVGLTPTMPFKPGELVQVSLTTGTLSVYGERPISPTVWQFKMRAIGGSAVFSDTGFGVDYWDIGLGDLDGDGDVDAVIAKDYVGNSIFFNDGQGGFTPSGQDLGSFNFGVALGDLDKDGDLDIVIGSVGGEVWFNDGAGSFTNSGQSLTGEFWEIALGDLDGDGDLDAFVGNEDDAKVWLNDGTGTFSDSGQSLTAEEGFVVLLADLDADRDLDAFSNWPPTIWLNDGRGNFSDSGQVFGDTTVLKDADFGDVDGDGDVDLLLSKTRYFDPNCLCYVDSEIELWLNDGSGGFVMGQSLGTQGDGAALGDLDGDGDLDAFVSVRVPQFMNRVWLNVGGTFVDSGQALGTGANGTALADFDGDGDLDAFADQVWLNEDVVMPIEGLSAENDSPTALGNATQLTATITAGSGVIYEWDFGDGSMGSGAAVSHVYSGVGVYTAVVTASNSLNMMTATTVVVVVDEAIVGLVVSSNSPVLLGEAAMLTATVSAGTNVSYAWDFGDGSMGSGAVVSHTYGMTGSFMVTVTATNSVGEMVVSAVVVVFEEEVMWFVYMPVAVKP